MIIEKIKDFETPINNDVWIGNPYCIIKKSFLGLENEDFSFENGLFNMEEDKIQGLIDHIQENMVKKKFMGVTKKTTRSSDGEKTMYYILIDTEVSEPYGIAIYEELYTLLAKGNKYPTEVGFHAKEGNAILYNSDDVVGLLKVF